MERRTWLQGLRGVKVSIIALGILGASFVSSVIHSRPASAESFLQKTVNCVTDVLALKNCAKSPATPATPASASNGQGATPAKPASASSTPAAVSSSQPVSYSGIRSGTEQAPLSTDTVQPTDTMPALPVDARDLPAYGSALYATYLFKTFGHMPTDATAAPAPLQASEEGWRLFGVAWYWWLMAAAAMTAAILALKRLRSQQTLSLVK